MKSKPNVLVLAGVVVAAALLGLAGFLLFKGVHRLPRGLRASG